jgi:hypothetical protein
MYKMYNHPYGLGHLNLGCGSWIRAGQSCYLLGNGKGYTWNQARDQCARANAQLVKVDGFDEKVSKRKKLIIINK